MSNIEVGSWHMALLLTGQRQWALRGATIQSSPVQSSPASTRAGAATPISPPPIPLPPHAAPIRSSRVLQYSLRACATLFPGE